MTTRAMIRRQAMKTALLVAVRRAERDGLKQEERR
jgi:hypothetical protein